MSTSSVVTACNGAGTGHLSPWSMSECVHPSSYMCKCLLSADLLRKTTKINQPSHCLPRKAGRVNSSGIAPQVMYSAYLTVYMEFPSHNVYIKCSHCLQWGGGLATSRLGACQNVLTPAATCANVCCQQI